MNGMWIRMRDVAFLKWYIDKHREDENHKYTRSGKHKNWPKQY
jgi:hypothetical protein